MDENKNHFYIPEEEVRKLDKKPRGGSKSKNICHPEHGTKLSSSLKRIEAIYQEQLDDDSLASVDLMVFQVTLPEEDRIQDQSRLFESTGLDVKAVKTVNKAVVATSKSLFEVLSEKVNKYTNSGSGKSYFDIIDDFEPYTGYEKNSSELKKTIYGETPPPEYIDVQLMLLPNLNEDDYAIILSRISKKLGEEKVSSYKLSDGTPVIRAKITPSSLPRYENDSAIYRIEETDFFSNPPGEGTGLTIEDFYLSDDVDIAKLPLVGILDSGVRFPSHLGCLVEAHWLPNASSGGDADHGTKVASLVVFRNFPVATERVLTPRARVIDCNILDGNVPVDVIISRIQEACTKFASICRVFNLSANSNHPIESDEMSILGYELDALQLRTGCLFVVSTGNHNLWKHNYSLEEIIDDDDSIISSPADSMLSIVVGAAVGENHSNSISQKTDIAPYSRRGPGFRGVSKPDLTAYAGTIRKEATGYSVPVDPYSLSLCRNGYISPDAGTSFSAPIISGDVAEVLQTAQEIPLLAKALLYHNARPIWSEDSINDDEDLRYVHFLYGRGISDVQCCKFSNAHRVTFIRTGTLNRTTKERVTFYMPKVLAAQAGLNVAKVTVTCLSQPPVDRTKGTEYLGAYIRASLHKAGESEEELTFVKPLFNEGRQKWDVCCQFSKLFTRFKGGDWQVWLELFSRWQYKEFDVPYALVISIEDMSGLNDIYQEIQLQNRFREVVPVRFRLQS